MLFVFFEVTDVSVYNKYCITKYFCNENMAKQIIKYNVSENLRTKRQLKNSFFNRSI